MLVVRELYKSYNDVCVLSNVSLTVPRCSCTMLLGPNGAGKSTLMRSVSGVTPFDRGVVEIDGIDLQRSSAAAKKLVGFCPESPTMYEEMTLNEVLELVTALRRLDSIATRATVNDLLDTLGLADMRLRRIGHLSKGGQHKVGLVCALVHEPALVILDEPFDGLDVATCSRLARYLRQRADAGCALLVSSHAMELAEMFGTAAVVICGGEIVFSGPMEMLLSQSGARTLGHAVQVVCDRHGARAAGRLGSHDSRA